MPAVVNVDLEVSMALPQPFYGRTNNGSTQQLPVKTKERTVAHHQPELRSTYHDSFGGSGGYMGPSYQSGSPTKLTPVPPSPRQDIEGVTRMSRLYSLEDRLSSQERAAQDLLARAVRIKEDVIENLNITHSTWQGEKKQRELLQDHIRSITEVVRKLDRDIKILEDQIRIKDSYITSSGNAIKSLELQQATTVTDMRGRIARCDASISKLATDQIGFQDGLKQAGNKHQDSFQRLQDKIQALEIKFAGSAQKLDKSNAESLLRTQSKEGDLARNVAVMETKLKGSIEELKLQLSNQKQVNDANRERAFNQLTVQLQKQESSTKDRLDKLEQKVDSMLTSFNKELNDLKSLSNVKELQKKQQEMEQRVAAMVNSALNQQSEKFNKLKNECRQGFSTVHESLTHSKGLLEGKLTLSEEQLRKEIGHIKKMVVVI